VNDFSPFSPLHLMVLLVIACAGIAIVALGRWLRSRERLAWLDWTLASIGLLGFLIQDALALTPFTWGHSLPLEVCDVMAFIGPIALVARRRWMFALLYFWGLTLSLQGLLTPQLREGPAQLHFWLFWMRHGGIVIGALYIVLVHDFRPEWRDYATAVGIGIAYVMVMLLIDVRWGFNYGYVGNAKPPQTSLVDFLGPWPWRVGAMIALAATAMAFLMAPWRLVAVRRAAGSRFS